jgi:ribosomal protein L18E
VAHEQIECRETERLALVVVLPVGELVDRENVEQEVRVRAVDLRAEAKVKIADRLP